MKRLLAALAALVTGLAVAGCSSQPASSKAAQATPSSRSASTNAPSPQPGPVVVRQGSLTGSCTPGLYDHVQDEFYTLGSLAQASDMTQGDPVSDAYELALSNASSAPVSVTGFTVAFYIGGRTLTSVAQSLAVTDKIPAGESAGWTEYPWGTYALGSSASAGPFADGKDGAVNPAVTCQLVHWSG